MEGNYLPGQEEVEQRKKDMEYLERQGIDDRLIRSAMMFDRPPPQKLKDAIQAGLSRKEIWDKFKKGTRRK